MSKPDWDSVRGFGHDLLHLSELAARDDQPSERRARLPGVKESLHDGITSGLLDRRKHETPATVIVLEALSEILPDDTYVTELRIPRAALHPVLSKPRIRPADGDRVSYNKQRLHKVGTSPN